MSKRKPRLSKELKTRYNQFRKELRTPLPFTCEEKDIWMRFCRILLFEQSLPAPIERGDLEAIRAGIKYVERQIKGPWRKMTATRIKHILSEFKKMESEIIAKQGQNNADQEEIK